MQSGLFPATSPNVWFSFVTVLFATDTKSVT